MANRWGNRANSDRPYFGGLQNHCRWWLQAMKLKGACFLEGKLWKPIQCIKKQIHYFADKGLYSQSYSFSSSHSWMWELVHKEGWALKNWCFWTVLLEKTLESLLDSKEIQPVCPKGNQTLNIHWKDWCWGWNSNALAIWFEELTHWKRLWCWQRLRAGGAEGSRGWDG